MADNASDYYEGKLADHEYGTGTYAKPTAQYIALFTSMPNDAGGGTEVSGGSYARQNLAPNSVTAGNWTVASDGTGVVSNAVAVTFPQATASWGNVVGMAIFDAATGGNMKVYVGLTDGSGNAAPQSIASGNTFSFPIGALKVTFS